jgi:hypothetical protein
MPPTYGKPLRAAPDQATKAVAMPRRDWMTMPGHICRDAVVTARAFYASSSLDRQDTVALVAQLGIPVLVLAANKDSVVPDVASSFAPLADLSRGECNSRRSRTRTIFPRFVELAEARR